jgi:hypothetical protein
MWKSMFVLVAFVAITAAVEAGDELTKALQTVSSADSYAFTLQDNPTGPGVEAKFQKGQPHYFKADRIEFFRKGDVLVYKQNDAWQKTRTGTLSDPLLILGASAKVRAARLPHEELAVLGKALTNVKKTAEKDGVLVTGDFAAEPARQLARSENRDLARGGTAKLWLAGDGRLAKYEIAIRVQGRLGNAEVDGTLIRTTSLSDLGKTKVELPAEAKKALE